MNLFIYRYVASQCRIGMISMHTADGQVISFNVKTHKSNCFMKTQVLLSQCVAFYPFRLFNILQLMCNTIFILRDHVFVVHPVRQS